MVPWIIFKGRFVDAVIIYQLIGFLGFGVGCLAFLFACPKANLWTLSGCAILWGIHHLALGNLAYIVAFLSAIRNILGASVSPKHILTIVATYIPIIWVLTIIFMENYYDIFPAIATSLGAIALLFRDHPFLYRFVCFSCEIAWVLYGLLVLSYALVFSALILMLSIGIAIARFDRPVIKGFFIPKKLCSDHFRQVAYQAVV